MGSYPPVDVQLCGTERLQHRDPSVACVYFAKPWPKIALDHYSLAWCIAKSSPPQKTKFKTASQRAHHQGHSLFSTSKAFHHLTEPRCSGRDWRSSQPTLQHLTLLAPAAHPNSSTKMSFQKPEKDFSEGPVCYSSPFIIGLPPNHFHRKSTKSALRSPRGKSPRSKKCALSSLSARNPRTCASKAPSASPPKP
jgi:hypothetical protein